MASKRIPPDTQAAPQEIELKLRVLGMNAEEALRRLARSPSLARRQPQRRWLVNRYYDTPDQQLRQHRCALRLRQTLDSRTPTAAHTGPWKQTLKTAGLTQGGLSQRGEWEVEVPDSHLQRAALQNTAWDTLDPDDNWFARLQPCFETRCERTTWWVRRRDGTVVEVAFDAGTVEAAGRRDEFLELELELVQGDPAALFGLARELAQRVPCLPSPRSKAERGQALADGNLHAVTKAGRMEAAPGESVWRLAQRAMADMLEQLTRNLEALAHDDAPELVHQARVGWRRWRSMEKLLRPWLGTPIDHTPLQPLLHALGEQRNLDVACTETLPGWAPAWPGDAAAWTEAILRLEQARHQQREIVRQRLATPATGLALLGLSEALWNLPSNGTDFTRRAARKRLARWHRKLHRLLRGKGQGVIDLASLHEARLLAKRLRYGSEALASAMSRKRLRETERWLADATEWQTRIGQARDAWQAAACLQQAGASEQLVYFLRGVGASMDRTAQSLARRNSE